MIAHKYVNEVYDSMSDFIHGNSYYIIEVFIPDVGLTFNYKDKLNVFDESRIENKIFEVIMLDKEFVEKLVEINNINKLLSVMNVETEAQAKVYTQ